MSVKWKGKFVATPISTRLTSAANETPLYNQSTELFDKFYEENKDKIKMNTTYPINYEALAEWQTALRKGPETLQQLGRYIAIGLKHVSFGEFYETLIRGAYEATSLCERENRKIILFIDGNLDKSNIWVALLVWSVIKSYVVFVDDGSNYTEWLPLTELQNILILHVDDGVFSGQQVGSSLTQMTRFLELQWPTDKLKWMVLVAALSKMGREVVGGGFPGVLFPTSAIELQTLGGVVKKTLQMNQSDWLDEYTKFFYLMQQQRYNNLYMVSEFKHVVYFDHKLPDSASTLNKVLATAPALDDTIQSLDDKDKLSTRSLIKRCAADDYEFDGKRPDPRMFLVKYDEEKVCPPSFYKNIVYTLDNKKIMKDEESFGDLLMKVSADT